MSNAQLIRWFLDHYGIGRRFTPTSTMFYQDGVLFSGNEPLAVVQGLSKVITTHYKCNLYITDPENLAGFKTALKQYHILIKELYSGDYNLLYHIYLRETLKPGNDDD